MKNIIDVIYINTNLTLLLLFQLLCIINSVLLYKFSSVQSLSRVRLFADPIIQRITLLPVSLTFTWHHFSPLHICPKYSSNLKWLSDWKTAITTVILNHLCSRTNLQAFASASAWYIAFPHHQLKNKWSAFMIQFSPFAGDLPGLCPADWTSYFSAQHFYSAYNSIYTSTYHNCQYDHWFPTGSETPHYEGRNCPFIIEKCFINVKRSEPEWIND